MVCETIAKACRVTARWLWLAGARRGGKTYLLVALMLATALDVPIVKGSALRGWIVSAAHSERDEVDKYLAELLLPGWAVYREWPQHRYKFVHGAELSNISADDPETLKRGRSDVMLVNEAQKMPSAVLTNAIGGTSDTGGIALLAANPPQRSRGSGCSTQQDIVNGEYDGVAQYFHFDPKLNPWIDHAAKSRVDKIIRRVSPTTALADEEGIWKRPGDLAYEAFNESKTSSSAQILAISRTSLQAHAWERLCIYRRIRPQ